MMNTKKALAMVTGFALMMGVMGCGNSAQDNGDQEIGKTTYTVGICQLTQHTALDAATKGFQDALIDILGEENITFDLQNAQGDSATCATIVNSFVASEVDLIIANSTASLQAAAAATNTIPILGTSITDYSTALDIEFDGVIGGNISGTSDLAPLDTQAEMIQELFPDITTIGLLYCTAESNSVYQIETIRGYLEEMGYVCESYGFSDSNDIATVCTKAATSCDLIYVPTDNAAADNAAIIDSICLEAGVPVFSGEENQCAGCGEVTLSISYYEMGYTTGEMAAEILQGGDISTMEIRYSSAITKKYVASRCEQLGISVPDEYVAIEE